MNKSSKTLLLSAGLVSLLALTACAASVPATVKRPADNMTLAPCPDSPNCVSTQAPATDAEHAIAPIPFTGSTDEAKQTLLAVLASMPRAAIVTDDGAYLHATFTSRVFRFVDDVEFVIDDSASEIHFRSASRVGYGDMGVNRNRMEEIRSKFAAQQSL